MDNLAEEEKGESMPPKEEEEEYDADEVFEAKKWKNENDCKCLNEYEIKEKLGVGSFGKVYRVTRSFFDEQGEIVKADYGMKVFNKVALQSQRQVVYLTANESKMITSMDYIYNEINVWRKLLHSNLIKLYQIINDFDDNKLYLIMQLADLGPLMEWNDEKLTYVTNNRIYETIKKKLTKQSTDEREEKEEIAKLIFKEIGKGLHFLHQKRIAHRDLKPDNILGKSDDQFIIKIGDFTTAKHLPENVERFFDIAGTTGFRAPELMFETTEGYDPFLSDMWSLGICLFTYIFEKMPFFSSDLSEIEIDIKSKNEPLVFPEKISEKLEKLLYKLLDKKPKARGGIEEFLNSDWINNN